MDINESHFKGPPGKPNIVSANDRGNIVIETKDGTVTLEVEIITPEGGKIPVGPGKAAGVVYEIALKVLREQEEQFDPEQNHHVYVTEETEISGGKNLDIEVLSRDDRERFASEVTNTIEQVSKKALEQKVNSSSAPESTNCRGGLQLSNLKYVQKIRSIWQEFAAGIKRRIEVRGYVNQLKQEYSLDKTSAKTLSKVFLKDPEAEQAFKRFLDNPGYTMDRAMFLRSCQKFGKAINIKRIHDIIDSQVNDKQEEEISRLADAVALRRDEFQNDRPLLKHHLDKLKTEEKKNVLSALGEIVDYCEQQEQKFLGYQLKEDLQPDSFQSLLVAINSLPEAEKKYFYSVALSLSNSIKDEQLNKRKENLSLTEELTIEKLHDADRQNYRKNLIQKFAEEFGIEDGGKRLIDSSEDYLESLMQDCLYAMPLNEKRYNYKLESYANQNISDPELIRAIDKAKRPYLEDAPIKNFDQVLQTFRSILGENYQMPLNHDEDFKKILDDSDLLATLSELHLVRNKNLKKLKNGEQIFIFSDIHKKIMDMFNALDDEYTWSSAFQNELLAQVGIINNQVLTDLLLLLVLSPDNASGTETRYLGMKQGMARQTEQTPEQLELAQKGFISQNNIKLGNYWTYFSQHDLDERLASSGNKVFLQGDLIFGYAIPGKQENYAVLHLDFSPLGPLNHKQSKLALELLRTALNNDNLEEVERELKTGNGSGIFNRKQKDRLKEIIRDFQEKQEIKIKILAMSIGHAEAVNDFSSLLTEDGIKRYKRLLTEIREITGKKYHLSTKVREVLNGAAKDEKQTEKVLAAFQNLKIKKQENQQKLRKQEELHFDGLIEEINGSPELDSLLNTIGEKCGATKPWDFFSKGLRSEPLTPAQTKWDKKGFSQWHKEDVFYKISPAKDSIEIAFAIPGKELRKASVPLDNAADPQVFLQKLTAGDLEYEAFPSFEKKHAEVESKIRKILLSIGDPTIAFDDISVDVIDQTLEPEDDLFESISMFKLMSGTRKEHDVHRYFDWLLSELSETDREELCINFTVYAQQLKKVAETKLGNGDKTGDKLSKQGIDAKQNIVDKINQSSLPKAEKEILNSCIQNAVESLTDPASLKQKIAGKGVGLGALLAAISKSKKTTFNQKFEKFREDYALSSSALKELEEKTGSEEQKAALWGVINASTELKTNNAFSSNPSDLHNRAFQIALDRFFEKVPLSQTTKKEFEEKRVSLIYPYFSTVTGYNDVQLLLNEARQALGNALQEQSVISVINNKQMLKKFVQILRDQNRESPVANLDLIEKIVYFGKEHRALLGDQSYQMFFGEILKSQFRSLTQTFYGKSYPLFKGIDEILTAASSDPDITDLYRQTLTAYSNKQKEVVADLEKGNPLNFELSDTLSNLLYSLSNQLRERVSNDSFNLFINLLYERTLPNNTQILTDPFGAVIHDSSITEVSQMAESALKRYRKNREIDLLRIDEFSTQKQKFIRAGFVERSEGSNVFQKFLVLPENGSAFLESGTKKLYLKNTYYIGFAVAGKELRKTNFTLDLSPLKDGLTFEQGEAIVFLLKELLANSEKEVVLTKWKERYELEKAKKYKKFIVKHELLEKKRAELQTLLGSEKYGLFLDIASDLLDDVGAKIEKALFSFGRPDVDFDGVEHVVINENSDLSTHFPHEFPL